MSGAAQWWPTWLSGDVRLRLLQAYDAPGRGYHDRQHLGEVLSRVEELMEGLMERDDAGRDAVRLAAWFHDAVYEGRADDEERSAQLALHELAGADAALAREVARLVRLTATHRPADDDRAGQVLCDADLWILGAQPDRYAAYTRGVREEYSHVGDADFAAGRAAVLSDLLAKPTLFHTEHARLRWEERARANVEREVSALRSR